jgi:M6 family metalloprotease-like protein
MSYARALKTLVVLAACATAAVVSDVVRAHDRSIDTRPGLSVAGRLASGSTWSVGPMQAHSGVFHVLFGDAPSGSGVAPVFGYVLVDDQGQATELLVQEPTLHALGGVRTINHQRVTVTGQPALTGMSNPAPLLVVRTLQLHGPPRTAGAIAAEGAVSGSQPWVTILCRFSDIPTITHPESWFETLMLGTVPPGLDHYWRELSFNNVNLAGSMVRGWYTLPQPRSYYVYGAPVQLDFGRAANDCTGVADGDVYFPNFVGINLMFNTDLDGAAWGGSWTLARDGVLKSYRMTWVPPWGYNNQGPIAHEMGHGFGLPHSSGPYSTTYDSRWDVMSDIWDNCPPFDPAYGCVGPHTIAYHKDVLGWIPPAQKYVAPPNSRRTLTLERVGQPTSSSSYLMAQIPIGNGSTFYTVETRRIAGYDTKLPGEAVVLHRVNPVLSDRNAQVVDPDGNLNPNDGGAMWLPGETFVDSANGIIVGVQSVAATSFQVSVQLGSPPASTPKATRDFNGDGKSDLLWRDTSGSLALWLMNGGAVAGNLAIGAVPITWTIIGIGDFDGDGHADILWRDTAGNVALWRMSGNTIVGTAGLGNVPTTWTANIGDFDGDGKADILWRNTTSGAVAIWLMNGGAVAAGLGLGTVPTAWTVIGIGDFDGDGKADILWQDVSGNLALWRMNGGTVLSNTSLGNVPLAWTAQVGDFNGDGKADVLWRHASSGAVAMWLMNGATVTAAVGLGTVTTTWMIEKLGDFDGDGRADMLWRGASGNVVLWLMNGASVTSSAYLGVVSPGIWATQ